MGRIRLNQCMQDVVLIMSDGNPGACACLCSMLAKKDWYGGCGALMLVVMLDEMGIYGSDIYKLWNDCCDRDLNKFETVLRNQQFGRLSTEAIKENLMQIRAKPFENLISIDELFKEFNKKYLNCEEVGEDK